MYVLGCILTKCSDNFPFNQPKKICSDTGAHGCEETNEVCPTFIVSLQKQTKQEEQNCILTYMGLKLTYPLISLITAFL